MQDIELECKDCKKQFVFTVGEQEFFQRLVDEGKMETFIQPRRCSKCRRARKNQE